MGEFPHSGNLEMGFDLETINCTDMYDYVRNGQN